MIDRTYDLSDIVETYRYVETQQKTGNVVITVVPSHAISLLPLRAAVRHRAAARRHLDAMLAEWARHLP